jgi:hypothetical protein
MGSVIAGRCLWENSQEGLKVPLFPHSAVCSARIYLRVLRKAQAHLRSGTRTLRSTSVLAVTSGQVLVPYVPRLCLPLSLHTHWRQVQLLSTVASSAITGPFPGCHWINWGGSTFKVSFLKDRRQFSGRLTYLSKYLQYLRYLLSSTYYNHRSMPSNDSSCLSVKQPRNPVAVVKKPPPALRRPYECWRCSETITEACEDDILADPPASRHRACSLVLGVLVLYGPKPPNRQRVTQDLPPLYA